MLNPARFTRTVQLALKSLMLHKLRSGLTMLGIVFGVFSVIAMLAIGEGASQQAQKQVLELGATNIICISVKPPDDVASQSNSDVLRYGLLREDFRLLSTTIPTVIQAIPIREITQQVRYLHRSLNARLVGCTPEYKEVNHLNLARGRFITDHDEQGMADVAVIAAETAKTLFPYEDPLDKAVKLGGIYYTVVGVTRERTASAAIGGSMSGQDYNKDVYIPLSTLRVRIGDQIIRQTQGSRSVENVELNQVTLRVQDAESVVATADVVRETLNRRHASTKDVSVVVPLELLKQADQLRYIFNIVLGSIAAISLVVGGIGIMNIMLATVTERTREIGVRRALGARQRDITEQFLTETVVLAGTGGLIGVGMGALTPYAFDVIQWIVANYVLAGSPGDSDMGRMFAGMQPRVALWSLGLAFGISVGIGVAFGLYPARAAARLHPIEALRHE